MFKNLKAKSGNRHIIIDLWVCSKRRALTTLDHLVGQKLETDFNKLHVQYKNLRSTRANMYRKTTKLIIRQLDRLSLHLMMTFKAAGLTTLDHMVGRRFESDWRLVQDPVPQSSSTSQHSCKEKLHPLT